MDINHLGGTGLLFAGYFFMGQEQDDFVLCMEAIMEYFAK